MYRIVDLRAEAIPARQGRPANCIYTQSAPQATIDKVDDLWNKLKQARFRGDRLAAKHLESVILDIVTPIPGGVVVQSRRLCNWRGTLQSIVENRKSITPVNGDDYIRSMRPASKKRSRTHADS